jgi:DNA-binding CsgD family transcriptional regulator
MRMLAAGMPVIFSAAARIREAIDCCVRQQRAICRKNELARQVERLSTRQREVLDLLVAGERSKQIARQLGIGEKTVASPLSRVKLPAFEQTAGVFTAGDDAAILDRGAQPAWRGRPDGQKRPRAV